MPPNRTMDGENLIKMTQNAKSDILNSVNYQCMELFGDVELIELGPTPGWLVQTVILLRFYDIEGSVRSNILYDL